MHPTERDNVTELRTVPSECLNARDLKRMLVLVISEVSDTVLSTRGVEATGLTVTISPVLLNGLPHLAVRATGTQNIISV